MVTFDPIAHGIAFAEIGVDTRSSAANPCCNLRIRRGPVAWWRRAANDSVDCRTVCSIVRSGGNANLDAREKSAW